MRETETIINAVETQDPRVVAYGGFESAFLKHSMEMGNIGHLNRSFNAEAALATAYELEERVFESIEAGCFTELEGLKELLQEISQSEGSARFHMQNDLAEKLDERKQAIENRLDVIEAELYDIEFHDAN